MKTWTKDVVIIGAGLAGLYTALNINSQYSVVVVSKGDGDTTGSKFAQGGIAACIGEDDCYDLHVRDTMIAGSYYNDEEIVRSFVEDGANEALRLHKMGVVFDADNDGNWLRTLEGGHSKPRVLHCDGDGTGLEIMTKLKKAVSHADNITMLDYSHVLKLVKEEERIAGVHLVTDGEELIVHAQKTVLATGGVGGQYLETTNPDSLFGEGIALAHEAGAVIRDAALVQFHPTALYIEGSMMRFLITEAMRGEGGILRNRYGKAFMQGYDKRKELAPRDVVSRAIHTEMQKTKSQHVWLDMTHHDRDFLSSRFPTIYSKLSELDIHMEEDMIPVVPVAHYFVGGVQVDETGRASMDDLYACGEVSSTGVHGGNRLASNSLLECIVYGKRIADDLNQSLPLEGLTGLNQDIRSLRDDNLVSLIERPADVQDSEYCRTMDETIKKLMMTQAGILRTDKGLRLALGQLYSLERRLLWRKRSLAAHQTRLRINMAKLIVRDALSKDSIGCHYKKNSRMNEVAI